MFERLLVGSALIKLTLLIWLKKLNKSESKRLFCNTRIQKSFLSVYDCSYFFLDGS